MSKLTRRPAVKPPVFDDFAPPPQESELPEGGVALLPNADPPPSAEEQPKQDLGKVATNNLTPLCPFCKSPKITHQPHLMGAYNKYRCNACYVTFAVPYTKH